MGLIFREGRMSRAERCDFVSVKLEKVHTFFAFLLQKWRNYMAHFIIKGSLMIPNLHLNKFIKLS
jgi:hypothetical protein